MMRQKSTVTAPGLALMGLGVVVGACEYVSVVILPEVAADLGVSLGAVGRLVSVFAAGYAIGTPVLMAATARVPRFRLLMYLMMLFLAANAVCMLAPNIWVLYVGRTLAAVLTGTLTAVGLLFAREAAVPGHEAKAIAMVYTGMALATVIGNPVNSALCRLVSWRAAFALILAAGAILLPVLARVLPRPAVVCGEDVGFLHQFSVLRDPRYSLVALMTVCYYAASYVVYTYLTPILTDVLGVGEHAISPLLMAVGLCCMGSNLLAGWLGGRGGVTRTPAVLLLQAVLLALMPLLLGSVWSGLPVLLLMCLLMYCLSTPVQLHALCLAEESYPFASNLCASTLSVSANIGIAAGSFASSGLQAAVGLRQLGIPAAVLGLAALGLNLALLRAMHAGAERRTSVIS